MKVHFISYTVVLLCETCLDSWHNVSCKASMEWRARVALTAEKSRLVWCFSKNSFSFAIFVRVSSSSSRRCLTRHSRSLSISHLKNNHLLNNISCVTQQQLTSRKLMSTTSDFEHSHID